MLKDSFFQGNSVLRVIAVRKDEIVFNDKCISQFTANVAGSPCDKDSSYFHKTTISLTFLRGVA